MRVRGAGTTATAGAAVAPFPLSDHFDGRRFFNPGEVPPSSSWVETMWWWSIRSRRERWPDWIELTPQRPPVAPTHETLVATWVNHSTVLVQTRHGNFLTDPIWGPRSSPNSWAGPKRVHAPGVRFEDLPRIDVVLLSHDHYDHCHLDTLARLARQASPGPVVVTPLGNGELARAAGFNAGRIVELDWWQARALSADINIELTPARHNSYRLGDGRNARLWGGFFVRAGGRALYFAGDTAHDEALFRRIRERCGAPDLALIPIGAYQPRERMKASHCDAAEAVEIHRILESRRSLGVHWGTFQLSEEGREGPADDLRQALGAARRPASEFVALAPGESVQG